jgi:hypothetical protein
MVWKGYEKGLNTQEEMILLDARVGGNWVDMDGKVFGPPPEVEERKVMTECQKIETKCRI